MDDRPIELPGARVTVMRGRGTRGDRSYWRARSTTPDRATLWAGWATRDEALVEALAAMQRRSSGPRDREAGVRVVGDLLSRWVAAQERRQQAGEIAPRTLRAYRVLASHWQGAIGDISVRRLRAHDVEDALTTWRSVDHMAPRSARQAAVVLRAAWAWGVRRDLCPPLELRRLAGEQVRESEYVIRDHTPARVEVAAALEHVREPYRAALRLMALTGARIGEIVAAQVEDWRQRDGVLLLHGRDPGRDRRGKVEPRAWPAQPELRELLDELVGDRSDGPLVDGLPPSAHTRIRQALIDACQVAKVPECTPHGLRRMVVLELLDVTDARTVSLLTGHSVQVLLHSYVRPDAARLRDAVRRAALRTTDELGQVVELRGHNPRAQPPEDEG